MPLIPYFVNYPIPKQTAFGKAPAAENVLVNAFGNDTRFVMTSPNDCNSLEACTT